VDAPLSNRSSNKITGTHINGSVSRGANKCRHAVHNDDTLINMCVESASAKWLVGLTCLFANTRRMASLSSSSFSIRWSSSRASAARSLSFCAPGKITVKTSTSKSCHRGPKNLSLTYSLPLRALPHSHSSHLASNVTVNHSLSHHISLVPSLPASLSLCNFLPL
jgi:hypothetical protein